MSNQINGNNVSSSTGGINAQGSNPQQSARAAMLHSLSRLTQQQIQQLVTRYSRSLELANQAPPSSDLQKQHLATAGKIKEILMNYSQLQKLKQQKQQEQSNNSNKNNNTDINNNANGSISSANNSSGNNTSSDSNKIGVNATTTNNNNKDNNNDNNNNNNDKDKDNANNNNYNNNNDKDRNNSNNNNNNDKDRDNSNNNNDKDKDNSNNSNNNNNNNSNDNANSVGSQNSTSTRPPLSSVEKSHSQSNLVNAPLMIQVQNLKRLSFIYQEHQKKLKSYKSFMERPNLTPETVNRLKLEATQVQQKMEQIKLASLKLNESLRQNRVNLSTLAQRQNTNNNAGNFGFNTDGTSNENSITSPGSNISNTPNVPFAPGSSPTASAPNTLSNQNAAASPGIISQVSTPKTPVVASSIAATPSIPAASTFAGTQQNNIANSNTAATNFTIPPAVLAKIQSNASVFIQQILAKGSVTLGGQEVNLNTMSPQNKVAFIKQISARYQQQQINLLKQKHLQQQANGSASLNNASAQQQQQLLNQIMASNTMTPQQKAQILQRLQNSQRAAQQQQNEVTTHSTSPVVTSASIRNSQATTLPKEGATDKASNSKGTININKNSNIQGLAVQVPSSAAIGTNGFAASAPGTPLVPVTPLTATSEVGGGSGAVGKKRLVAVNGSAKIQGLGKSPNLNSAKVLKKNESKKSKKSEGTTTVNTGVPSSSAVGKADAVSYTKGSISTSSMNNGSGGVGHKQHPTVSYNNNNKTVEKLKFNTVTENGRQQLFIHQGKMKRKIPDLELSISEAETVTGKTSDFVASWKNHFMHSIPLASYRKTAHIKGILNTPKYLQLPEVTENDQKNLDDAANNTSTIISSGVGISGNNALEGTSSGITENGTEGDLITKSKLKELIQSVNPNISIDGDVEDILLDISDEFIHNLCRFSCNLAKRRRTDSIQVKDIQLHLDRFYNIKIPGFDSDEIRNIRKWAPTNGYLNKISGVEVSRSVDRQEK